MRKHMVGMVLGLMLLMPAAARAQFNAIQPQDSTGPLSHPGFDQGGWFIGTDFLFLAKAFGTYNGTAPDSILSFGYRTADNIVYEFSWWDQWYSETPTPNNKLEILEFSTRFETYNTGCFREYGVIGIRGILAETDFAVGAGTYSMENNMVGPFIGCMNEWYLGENPLGAWSFILDGNVGAYANFLRQAVAGSVLNTFTLSGSLEGKAGYIWYVHEGITIHFGLEAMTIINLQQFPSAPSPAGNSVTRPTMPVWLGGYLAFGFVF